MYIYILVYANIVLIHLKTEKNSYVVIVDDGKKIMPKHCILKISDILANHFIGTQRYVT